MTDFSALYQKYAADVFRFALYLSGNRADAEDITSETFVRAWTSPERIEMTTVKAYLFTIARNLFLKGLRHRSRHGELDENLRQPGADAYLQFEQKMEYRLVKKALQDLPELHRAALLMRTLDGLGYEEIAEVLQISVSAAKVNVHRARKALLSMRNLQHS